VANVLEALPESELPAALDRIVSEMAAGRDVKTGLMVDRRTDDVFDVSIMVNPGPGTRSSLTKVTGLDLGRVRAIVAWGRAKGASMSVSFTHWPAWATSSLEERTRALMSVFEIKPLSVAVYRSKPSSERGEEPRGQPNIIIEMADGDFVFQTYLELVITSRDEHDRVEADFVARAQALGVAFGIPCEVG